MSASCFSNILCSNCRGKHHKSVCTFTCNNGDKSNIIIRGGGNTNNNNNNNNIRNNNVNSNMNDANNNSNINEGMFAHNMCNNNGSNINNNTNTQYLQPQLQQTVQSRVNDNIRSPTILNLSRIDAILLQTARANFTSDNNNSRKVAKLRIIFDSGSRLSYITPEARNSLQLESLGWFTIALKTFGNSDEKKQLEVKFRVCSKQNTSSISVEAFVSSICYPIEHQAINLAKTEYRHLEDLQLADEDPEDLPLHIDILIGCANYWDFMTGETKRGVSGPVALGSTLGYILSGSVEKKNDESTSMFTSHVSLCLGDTIVGQKELIRANLSQLYGNEELRGYSEDDVKILEHFEENTILNNENRYEVRLPFRRDAGFVGDNYRNAYNRLGNLFKQFQKNKDLLVKYNDIIQDELNQGVVEVAPKSHDADSLYFLPQAVVRENKKTTSVRMVYDARMKSAKNGLSLNDILEKGPLLTPMMFKVLIRFRCRNIVVNGDIEKAFLQNVINKDDRDYLRFLWVENMEEIDYENIENKKFVELRNCRVLFGLKPSPHLLSAVLRKHIKNYPEIDQYTREKLIKSLHVDDLLSSLRTDEEAFMFYEAVKSCLAAGNFNLRKFSSNSKSLEDRILSQHPEDEEYLTVCKQKLFRLM